MTSWWHHHGGHGSLISGGNSLFLACKGNNLAISHPVFTKLGMNDAMGSMTSLIQWRHNDVITGVTAHWFQAKIAHSWLVRVITWQFIQVYHPIFNKLDINDVTGSRVNPIWWRHPLPTRFSDYVINRAVLLVNRISQVDYQVICF